MTRIQRTTKRLLTGLVPSMRTLRVTTYATFVFVLLALLAARSVYADAREIALGVGHQLGTLEDLTGGAYRLHVNGAEVNRSSAHTALSVKEVLDRYEAYCSAGPSALGLAMRDIPQALEGRVKLRKEDPIRRGIVREQSGDRGMVACFVDDGATSQGLEGVRDRIAEFRRTGDLTAFGKFRYAFVEKRARGGSYVVTLWSDGGLAVGRMFPASGDAPGTDSTLAPRPAGSRRTFAAWAEGYHAGVRIYETRAPRAEVERHYDDVFAKAEFQKVARGEGVAYVGSDGTEVFVALRTEGDRTFATVVEAGRDSAREVRADGREP